MIRRAIIQSLADEEAERKRKALEAELEKQLMYAKQMSILDMAKRKNMDE
jgi:hypothetical protein